MSCAQRFSPISPSLDSGIPPLHDDERPDEGGYDPNDGIPATSKLVHPAGIIMNCSHASAVGSRFGLFWMTILAIISCAQLALPVIPLLVVFRKRPLEVIEKLSGFHSFINIAVAVGVVVRGNNPTAGSSVGGADDFTSQ